MGLPKTSAEANKQEEKLTYFFFFQSASIANGTASSDGHPAYTIRERHDFHSV